MNINKIFFSNINNNFVELKKRLIFFLFSIFILRIGNFISIPSINIYYINLFLNKYNNSTFLNFLKLFSSGSLLYSSIFMLGIMPYISSSIVIQLLTVIFPYFINLKKEGIEGKFKLNKYTKYLTLLLSILQSIFLSLILYNKSIIYNNFLNTRFMFVVISVLSLITGTMFLMWFGEKITEKGLGNGISIIIFINIISSLPNFILNIFKINKLNYLYFLKLIFLLFVLFLFVFFIVLVEISQRKILIQYAMKGYQKNKYSFLNSEDTYLPLKINLAGVIPSIFTSSIMILPSFFFIWLNNYLSFNNIFFFIKLFYPKHFLYLLLYLFLIVFFCFFYTLLIFNPLEISENLKKTGAYIPNIRPGLYTNNFIKNIVLNLTLFNSVYMCIVCIIPDFIYEFINLPFYLIGGTSLLIIVVVVIDLITQIQSLLISNKYLSILKKKYF